MTVCNPEPGPIKESAEKLDLPEGVPPLASFYLYLTNGCNLRCRHCWITPSFVDGKPSPGEYLDPGALRQAIAEARPLGLCNVKLTGGEPTLHPQFVEVVDLLAAEGLRAHIETNGTLIDADLAHHLKEHTSVWFVSVSLDGPTAEVHDPFRGVKGSFDAAVGGIRHLVDAGYRPQIIMCPHRGNVQYVEDVVKLAIDLGASSVKFNPVTRAGRGAAMHERNETLDIEDILDLARFVRGPLQRRTPIRLFLNTPPALYTVGELAQVGPNEMCQVLYILGILGSGQMALCGIGRTIPELCFGKLGEVSVADVWLSHPTLHNLRQTLAGEYPGLCGQCIHARRCLTHCVADNYQRSGRLVAPHSMCASAHERGLFPATRLKEARCAL